VLRRPVESAQYASNDYRKLLRQFKMESSMSRKGDCWDNAVTETLFGSLKVERLHGMRFTTRRLAQDEVMDWITFYNHRRLHSTLGYSSPMPFEQKWLAGQICLVA
jgi:putative transposase